MPKKETPGVVRQDGTRGGGHLVVSIKYGNCKYVIPVLCSSVALAKPRACRV